jgi:5-methylcytosine-specific restriction enzyme A
MPFAAPNICACGKAVRQGVICLCQSQRRQESKARFDATRPNSNARGYDARWATARKDYLTQYPRCAHDGCNAFAAHVHHMIAHKGDMKLFWDRSRWQGLCAHHHNSNAQREEYR